MAWSAEPTLYLRDALYVDRDTLISQRGDFSVERGYGGGIHAVPEIPPGVQVLECGGRIVTRAFAVAHHHIYSSLARGMPPPTLAPTSFREILERVWWRLDRALDAELIATSARIAALDLLHAGVTCVIDHHSSPCAAQGSLGLIADVLDAAGVEHLLCLELSDRDGPAALQSGLAESQRHAAKKPALIGLHASFTVSDPLLREAVMLARSLDTGVHVHVAEAQSDQEETLARHGCRVVQRLADAGALDLRGTLLAHCLHLDASERDLIAGSRAWVVQNPESNRLNAVGAFDPRGLGDRILLGTDGMHGDALASLRAAYLDGQSQGGLTPGDAWKRLQRVDDYLEARGLRRGDNDLVVIDYDSPTPVGRGNFAAHAVYGSAQWRALHVVAAGRVVLENGVVQTMDEGDVRARARLQALRLWTKMAGG